MRRSSGRQSLLPLRVKNEGGVTKATSRNSGSRSSLGGRSSIGGRQSSGAAFGSSLKSRKSFIPKHQQQSSTATSSNLFGKTRRSSGYGRNYGPEVVKELRPVTDRKFKEETIRLIVEFLCQQGYPHQISTKVLHTPQTKDFIRIFEFMMQFVDPKYKIGPKHEEEIPKIFKSLHYPFTISKQSMFSVGSPHTWPHLLAALRWLIHLVQFALHTEPEAIMFPLVGEEIDCESDSKIQFDFVEKAYVEFLAGADEHPVLEEELRQKIRAKTEGLSGGLEHLVSENNRLRAELDALESEPDRLSDMKTRYQVIVHDDQKYQNYLSEMDSHRKLQEQKYKEVQDEQRALATEMEALQEEMSRMQHIFDTQELSPADVERLNLSRQQLQTQIEAVSRENEDLDRQVWDMEMNIGKSQERVDAKCQNYNKMAQMLKLIPPSAENAFGRDYEMRANFNSYGQGSVDFNNLIKPALTQMKNQCNEKVHEAEARKISEMDALEQVNEMVAYKREEISVLEANVKEAEDDIECKKESMQRELLKAQKDLEVHQTELAELKQSMKRSVREAEELLSQTKIRCETRLKAMNQKENAYMDFITTALTQIMEHKALIEKSVFKTRDTVNKHVQQAMMDTQK